MLQRMLGRGSRSSPPGAGVARSVERALAARELLNPRAGEGELPLPVHRRRRLVQGARHALPADAARRVVHVELEAQGGGMSASAATAARPTSCARSTIEPGFVRTATGSALISMGETRVICTASVQESVPRWLAGSGRGWVTAEYGMLPASTGERKQRDVTKGRPDGRTVEIQRLIGRSLRGVVDFDALGERTIYVDCDVLQADGGTRCASITGGLVALRLACERLIARGRLERSPLTGTVAAVSCGIVDGVPLLDLDYSEDSAAEVDANVVMTGDGGLVEVQATAERTPLSRAHLDELLALAAGGIDALRALQDEAVAAAAALMSAPGAALVLATRNPHKVREFARLLEPAGIAVVAAARRGRAAAGGRRDLRRERAAQGPHRRGGHGPAGDRRRLGDRGRGARRRARRPLGAVRRRARHRRGEPREADRARRRPGAALRYVCALAYVDPATGEERVFVRRLPRAAGGRAARVGRLRLRPGVRPDGEATAGRWPS